MKLYVIPVGKTCNAKCKFCITKYRGAKNNFLEIEALEKALSNKEYEKIEITGGGEPGLHPKINKIVELCSKKAKTQIYTNGTYQPPLNSGLKMLCLSRAHYDNKENEKTMGVRYLTKNIHESEIPIKLSLIMHRSGISTEKEAESYLRWASDFCNKVVIRQLFEYENEVYEKLFKKEYVNTLNLFKGEGQTISGNRFLKKHGLTVEIEGRTCACEQNNPVLLASGEIKKGWVF